MGKPMKLSYTNTQGRRVDLHSETVDGKFSPYIVQYVEGTGGPGVQLGLSAPAMKDGTIISYKQLKERTLKVQAMVYGATAEERDLNLRELVAVLHPAYGPGRISYSDHAGDYTINGACSVMPTFSSRSLTGHWKPVIIDFVCPTPLWRGTKSFSELLAYTEARFRLPYTLPYRLGTQGYKAQVNNPLPIQVPMDIRIWGPAIIPEIVNETNGMRMRVHREIGPGEMLAIDSGAETVQLYSNSAWSDASGYIDFLRSDYVLLDPGPNSLAYFNLDDSVNTRVEVSWGDWYLGVG